MDQPRHLPELGFAKYEDLLVYRKYMESIKVYPFEVFSRRSGEAAIMKMPMALRLSICAFCSILSKPRPPDVICRGYYTMARDHLMWCIDNPGLESLQTLLNITFAASFLGDHQARLTFRDMSNRMATLLQIDTPALLVLPDSNQIRAPSEEEMELRDTENGIVGFEQTQILSSRAFRRPHPNDISLDTLFNHLGLLSNVVHTIHNIENILIQAFERDETVDDPITIHMQTLRVIGSLQEWKNALPPSINLDNIPDYHPEHLPSMKCTREAILNLSFTYHATVCLLGRVVLKATRYSAVFTPIAERWTVVALTSTAVMVKICKDSQFSYHPFLAFCGMTAAAFMVDVFERLEGGGKEVARNYVKVFARFVGAVVDEWPNAGAFVGVVNKLVKALGL
ncbi:hypothetical protein BC829DRAFT_421109 [Chytridium lagenaria]|nr:hypothetical protein BC829DRAFT_421109 [Chytridium lagenaria]